MIFPEHKQSIGYTYDPDDLTKIWYFGDFLRKTSILLNDSDDKWKLVCQATNIQNTEQVSLDTYRNNLQKFELQLTNYIATHQDPFIIK